MDCTGFHPNVNSFSGRNKIDVLDKVLTFVCRSQYSHSTESITVCVVHHSVEMWLAAVSPCLQTCQCSPRPPSVVVSSDGCCPLLRCSLLTGRTQPRQVTVLQYLVSVAVAVGVSPPGATWTDSYFSDVGDMVGGAPLRLAIVAAGVLSCIGQFEAEMSADSFEILGLAERRMIPKVFSHRSRFDTPTYGIAVGLVVSGCTLEDHFKISPCIVSIFNSAFYPV